MKNKELLEEFHALAEKLDIKIMKGKGDFSGGDCIVNEKKVIVINNIKPIEQRLNTLAVYKNYTKITSKNIFTITWSIHV